MFEIELKECDLKEITLNDKPVKHIINADLKQMVTNHLLQNYGIKMTCTNKYFAPIEPTRDLDILKRHKHYAYVNTNQRINLMFLEQHSIRNQFAYILTNRT